MKLKTLIAATALVAISGSAMAAQLNTAVTGSDINPYTAVVKFTGGLVDNTCDVFINGDQAVYGYKDGIKSSTSDADGSVAEVKLGYYTVAEATVGGTGAGAIALGSMLGDEVDFDVELANCPTTGTVSYQVVGASANASYATALKTENEALGIVISNETGGKSILNSASVEVAIDATAGTGSIPLFAQYQIVKAGAEEGSASAFAAINFDYN